MSVLRTRVTARIKALLEGITTDNGYRTNVGRRVHIARRRGNEHEAPCIYLVPGPERSGNDYGLTVTEADFSVAAMINFRDTMIDGYPEAPTEEWVIADAVLADVRQCMEGRDTDLEALIDGLAYTRGSPVPSEDGGELVGVELTYAVRYAIARGDPDNPPS